VTADGIERDLAVSYLNRLVILREIVPRLGKARNAARRKPRVLLVGYPGTGQAGNVNDLNAEKSYSAFPVHMNTVAGSEVLMLDAQRAPEGDGRVRGRPQPSNSRPLGLQQSHRRGDRLQG
jgi:hypothetical protein